VETTTDAPNTIDHQTRKIDVWTKVMGQGKAGLRVEREGGSLAIQLRQPDGSKTGLVLPLQLAEALRDILRDACAIDAVSVETLDLACTRAKEQAAAEGKRPVPRYGIGDY
jgi:hypothetical protein